MAAAATRISKPPATMGVRTGRITGFTAEGAALVDFEGNLTGPKPARATASFDNVADISEGTAVLLVFEDGDLDFPIIAGLLSSGRLAAGFNARAVNDPAPKGQRRRKVVLEADEEIVLRCGRSSLTLRQDGKIILHGRDLISRASRRNRIQGGSVAIN